jgi:predicted outer membrane repeat protein
LCSVANNTTSLRDCTFAGNRIANQDIYRNRGYYGYDYFSDVGSGNGGGLYCGDNSTVTVDNCTFSRNSNGIKDYDISTRYYDSSYYYYYYDRYLIRGDGGAIYCGTGTELTLDGSLISENESTYSGGGLYLASECSATIVDSTTVNNDANESGGGLYCAAGSVIDVNNSGFADNSAASGSGGGICLWEVEANIINSSVTENVARRGGGLYWSGGDVKITDCVLSENSATGRHEAGGGFYCIDSGAGIENSIITDNTVPDGFGGGGYVAGLNQEPIIKNCLITGNSVGYYGGGIYVDLDCIPIITHCTFVENSALKYGGALYCTNDGHATVRDSIFWDNSADLGSAQIGVLAGSGGADVSYCDVQGGYPGVGNINADPCFVGDYYLSQPPDQNVTSLCVDKGSGPASTLGFGELTTATNGKLDSDQIDMGYHHRPDHFSLIVNVIGRYGTVTPRRGDYKAGTIVTLRALPERGYKVLQWTGTDDDSSTSNVNTVTMDSDKTVTVEFEFAHTRTLVVPGDGENRYMDLQSALDAARDGDVIILNRGVWPWGGFNITDKVVMITSTAPDDPTTVAETVIDCSATWDYYWWWWGGSGGFYFGQGSGSSVLNGLTIRGARGSYGGYLWDDYGDPFYGYRWWSHSGGAIYCSEGTSPVISNCLITDAAVYGPSYGGWGDAADGFNGRPGVNGGSGFGGAIYVGPHSSPLIVDCRIYNSRAIGGNGGPGQNGGAYSETLFRVGDGGRGGWPGQAYGGGIYCASGSTPTVIGCIIDGCQAIGGNGGDGGSGGSSDGIVGEAGFGGGWSTSGEWDYWWYGSGDEYDYYDPLYYTSPYYRDYYWNWWYWFTREKFFFVEGELWEHWGYAEAPWYYSGHGGGIYCESGSKPTFIDCRISNNTADGGVNGLGGVGARPHYRWDIPGSGGGVYCAPGSQATFDNCRIINNTVAGVEAALSVDPNDPNAFDPNTYIQIPYSGYGGGMCLRETFETTVTGCEVSNNQVRTGFGGGIYLVNADLKIDTSDVVDNVAQKGGGLSAFDGRFEMTECRIRDNSAISAGEGGGMYLYVADAEITDSIIVDNLANWSGGGFYLVGDASTTGGTAETIINNCLIVHNLARRDGGGISSNWYAEPLISNCTIADNLAIGIRARIVPTEVTLTLSIRLSGTMSVLTRVPNWRWAAVR